MTTTSATGNQLVRAEMEQAREFIKITKVGESHT
jgi:hypothetical protein